MKKLFTITFLVFALLVMTAGSVFAQESTTITGTVQSILLVTDPATGNTTLEVTYTDSTNTTQTVTIDLQTAEYLGLVAIDPITTKTTIAVDAIGKIIQITPPPAIEEIKEDQHPVSSALSDFFSKLLGVDYETITTTYEDGVGFGVIAQALWMTNSIDGGSEEFQALIEAKQSGDYSLITLADGSTPANWGDVIKSLKKGDNLGSIMSGKAEQIDETSENIAATVDNSHGNNVKGASDLPGDAPNGNGNNSNNDNANQPGNNNGHGNSGSNGNGQGNGGGKP
ncbi:MAG: hypothetical protein IPJ46_18395 [Anaerolineales bacterium]|nr:hypothetical protein [Anaerolineales bacterium]